MIFKLSQVNGNLTLEENICDFAGFQQAYRAFINSGYKSNVRLPGMTSFTSDQLFFIQYAQVWCEIANDDGHKKSITDTHSPGRFRANGVLVNSKQFGDAFNCEPNSPMNPVDKCRLWSFE